MITKELNHKMLMELSKTDKAMAYAVKHNLKWLYEETYDERMSVIASWLDYRIPKYSEWVKLLKWQYNHNLF